MCVTSIAVCMCVTGKMVCVLVFRVPQAAVLRTKTLLCFGTTGCARDRPDSPPGQHLTRIHPEARADSRGWWRIGALELSAGEHFAPVRPMGYPVLKEYRPGRRIFGGLVLTDRNLVVITCRRLQLWVIDLLFCQILGHICR